MAEFSTKQVLVVASVAGALVGGVVAGGVAAAVSGGNGGAASSQGGSGQDATTPVVRTTLTTTEQVGGSIGYGGAYTVTALGGGGGVYTWLPTVGQVIRQDQPVYSVNNKLVPLLYGSIPAYRAFNAGMSGGADVGELTRDLIALGFGDGLAQSDGYSAATAAAVERWQRAAGLPATGEIPLGEVVFEPGPLRVTSVSPSPGESVAGGGTVLTGTSTTPVVTVNLDVSEEFLVKPGDAVSVVLPDGITTVGGHIETVGTVAACPGGGGVGTGGSAGESPCESSGSGTSSAATVTVTITLDSTPPGAALDQAPVNVNITSQTVPNVLAVPVNALLALQGGGYGVEVVTGKTTHLAGVTAGVYSDTLVQVSGVGITAGTVVEVPAS
jgi:peptidoglycan hydrolase-like protein with peptidoglycan-binding domain